ncbi:MAG: GNAT family N-acetyltransferase [Acetatifactor sp.]|nr:GNAT family N-acetyltransferase [Acetatifactor sp.]
MRLETRRLILRDYEESDKTAYFKLKSDSKTMYYLQDIQLFTQEESDIEFAKILQDQKSKDRKFYFLHMELKDSHEQVGSVGYTVNDNTPVGKLVGAGYFIFPQFWNQGYVTEAFKRVLEFAFLENNVYRITTGCLSENIGSEKVMQKCGLIKEAEHVDWEWHDGKMKTRLEYRLLKNEWIKLQADQ